MRKEFIKCASRTTARRRAPWAAATIQCEDGFMVFECVNEARIFRGQK